RFGYTDRPEYRSLSFVQDGTQYCEVQVTVLQPRTRPDLEPLTVTAFGTQSGDAHQIAARKTLLLFCQRHEEEVRDTPCRYFPLYEHTEAQWQHRLSALQGPDQREEDPTVVASAWYIMAMDKVAPAPASPEVAPVPVPAPAYGFLSESDEEPSEEEDAPMAEDDPELELLEDPLQGEEDTESEHEMDYPSDPGSDYSDSMDEDDFPILEGYVPQYMLEMEEDEDQGIVNFVPVSDDQPVVVDPPAPQQPAPAGVPVQQPPALFAPPAQQQPALPAGHQLALVAPPAAQHPLAVVTLGPLFSYQPVLAPPTAQHYPAAPQQAPQMLGDTDLFEYYQLLRAHEEWSDPYDQYRAWRRDHGYDQY
ncbi:hypothetical protein EJB05_39770, partial [Eragrostis curvula]